jgi:hypothetical protein
MRRRWPTRRGSSEGRAGFDFRPRAGTRLHRVAQRGRTTLIRVARLPAGPWDASTFHRALHPWTQYQGRLVCRGDLGLRTRRARDRRSRFQLVMSSTRSRTKPANGRCTAAARLDAAQIEVGSTGVLRPLLRLLQVAQGLLRLGAARTYQRPSVPIFSATWKSEHPPTFQRHKSRRAARDERWDRGPVELDAVQATISLCTRAGCSSPLETTDTPLRNARLSAAGLSQLRSRAPASAGRSSSRDSCSREPSATRSLFPAALRAGVSTSGSCHDAGVRHPGKRTPLLLRHGGRTNVLWRTARKRTLIDDRDGGEQSFKGRAGSVSAISPSSLADPHYIHDHGWSGGDAFDAARSLSCSGPIAMGGGGRSLTFWEERCPRVFPGPASFTAAAFRGSGHPALGGRGRCRGVC